MDITYSFYLALSTDCIYPPAMDADYHLSRLYCPGGSVRALPPVYVSKRSLLVFLQQRLSSPCLRITTDSEPDTSIFIVIEEPLKDLVRDEFEHNRLVYDQENDVVLIVNGRTGLRLICDKNNWTPKLVTKTHRDPSWFEVGFLTINEKPVLLTTCSGASNTIQFEQYEWSEDPSLCWSYRTENLSFLPDFQRELTSDQRIEFVDQVNNRVFLSCFYCLPELQGRLLYYYDVTGSGIFSVPRLILFAVGAPGFTTPYFAFSRFSGGKLALLLKRSSRLYTFYADMQVWHSYKYVAGDSPDHILWDMKTFSFVGSFCSEKKYRYLTFGEGSLECENPFDSTDKVNNNFQKELRDVTQFMQLQVSKLRSPSMSGYYFPQISDAKSKMDRMSSEMQNMRNMPLETTKRDAALESIKEMIRIGSRSNPALAQEYRYKLRVAASNSVTPEQFRNKPSVEIVNSMASFKIPRDLPQGDMSTPQSSDMTCTSTSSAAVSAITETKPANETQNDPVNMDSSDCNEDSEVPTCSVCFDSLVSQARVAFIPCGHVFCKPCGNKIFDLESLCPKCRRKPDTKIEIYL